MRVLAALLGLSSLALPRPPDSEVRAYLEETADRPPPTPEEEKPRWEVTGAVGMTATSGNSDTFTLAAGLEAKREWEPWKLLIKLDTLYSKSDGDQNANEQTLTERLERALNEKESIFQDLLLEHDEQEELDYRIQLTVGYRRRLVNEERFKLWGEAGGGVLHEEFRVDPETEGILQFGFDFEWKLTKQLTYTQRFVIYPSLSEGGEYRFRSESRFTTPIGERLDLRLSIIDDFDSDPVPGVEENDVKVALTVAIKFTKPKEKEG
jgi:putative salt-induced outer membrane protein YdiY